jgi:hypothetical protein
MPSIAGDTLNPLEVIRVVDVRVRVFKAGPSESVGETGLWEANEDSPSRQSRA